MTKPGTIRVFDKNNLSAYIPIICDCAFKVCEKYVFYKIEEMLFSLLGKIVKLLLCFVFSTHAHNSLPKKPSRYISDL